MRMIVLLISLLISLNVAFTQERHLSYFIAVGNGLALGDWGLGYVVNAGLEFPMNDAISMTPSLSYMKFTDYTYSGIDTPVSHGTKSAISLDAEIKFRPRWTIAPFVAGGLGLAWIDQGDAVHRLLSGSLWQPPPKSGIRSFGVVRLGVEVFILKKIAVSAVLSGATSLASDILYQTMFTGQLGLRISV